MSILNERQIRRIIREEIEDILDEIEDEETLKEWSEDEKAPLGYPQNKWAKLDWGQSIQVRKGLEAGLDVSIYDDPKKYDEKVMEEFRKGLEDGFDLTKCYNPKSGNSSHLHLAKAREALKSGIDIKTVEKYCQRYADSMSLYYIFEGLKKGYDITWLDDVRLDYLQQSAIWYGLINGLDVSIYADPKISGREMKQIVKDLDAEKNSSSNTLNITNKQINEPPQAYMEYLKTVNYESKKVISAMEEVGREYLDIDFDMDDFDEDEDFTCYFVGFTNGEKDDYLEDVDFDVSPYYLAEYAIDYDNDSMGDQGFQMFINTVTGEIVSSDIDNQKVVGKAPIRSFTDWLKTKPKYKSILNSL